MPGKRSFINIVELSRWRIDTNSANLDTIRSGMERAMHLMPYRQRSSYSSKSRGEIWRSTSHVRGVGNRATSVGLTSADPARIVPPRSHTVRAAVASAPGGARWRCRMDCSSRARHIPQAVGGHVRPRTTARRCPLAFPT